MGIKKYSSKTWEKKYPDFHLFKKEHANPDELHTHDFIEIVLVTKGTAKEMVNGEKYLLKHGDMLIMDYGCEHSVLPIENFSYVNLLIYPKLIEENRLFFQKAFLDLTAEVIKALPKDKRHEKVSFVGAEKGRIEKLLNQLLSEQSGNLPLNDIMKESYMISLLVEIRRKQVVGQNVSIGDFDEVLLYINNNLEREFTASDCAKKFSYNPSYFSRMFKKKTGITLREYIFKKRMEKAAALLIHTDKKIEDIIAEVGYESRSSFFRNFYRVYNMTPSEYRKMYGEQDHV